MEPQDRILIGVVGKPHGVRGGFYMDGPVDAAALKPGLEIQLGDTPFTIASRGGTDARPLINVEELGDRDAIVTFRGAPITARREDLSPLGEGEWFADDLIGLAVVDKGGRVLGEVKRLANLPSVDILEVAAPDGELLQVPMIKDAILSIDPAGDGVVVDAGFLNLG